MMITRLYSSLFLAFFLVSVGFVLDAQQKNSAPYFLSASSYYGQFQVHSKDLSPFNGSHPRGVEIEISRLFLSSTARDISGCYSKVGLGFNYLNFDHSGLGYGYSLLLYGEPFFKVRGKWRFSAKAGIGLSWLSQPYDVSDNPQNMAYSTYINFPLYIGASFYYFISNRWAIKSSVAFQHLSNGGINYPNLGVNYPTLHLGLEHAITDYRISPSAPPSSYRKENYRELTGMLALQKDTANTNKRGILALQFMQSWQVARVSALTAGVCGEYEGSYEGRENESQYSVGLLVGHEFIFGQMGFGQQLGVYVLPGFHADHLLFQQYYLYIRVIDSIVLGIGLRAHGKEADYPSVQIGVLL